MLKRIARWIIRPEIRELENRTRRAEQECSEALDRTSRLIEHLATVTIGEVDLHSRLDLGWQGDATLRLDIQLPMNQLRGDYHDVAYQLEQHKSLLDLLTGLDLVRRV